MFSGRFTMRLAMAFAGSLAFLAPIELSPSTAYAQPVTIENLVLYGVPQDGNDLFRYEFGSDSYSSIGVVTDQYGREVVDIMSVAYIPSGPHKAIYGASEEAPFEGYLIKIDPLTADATVYEQPMGWSEKVAGMVAYQSGGQWLLLATEKNKDLFSIDPATGVGTYLCTLSNFYGGLSMDANGLVYAAYKKEVWAIDLPDRIGGDQDAEWKVGQHEATGIEAQEFAFGMNVQGLDDDWYENGLLFTYGSGSGLFIVNPDNGAAIPYPCAIPDLDLEGLAFMPETTDGFGQITVNACD